MFALGLMIVESSASYLTNSTKSKVSRMLVASAGVIIGLCVIGMLWV